VCPPDEEYDNARTWRVTVRLDASQRILAIEQEVEVRCTGRQNGMDVDAYIHEGSRPEQRTDEAAHVGRLVQEIARLHGRIEDIGRIVGRVTRERDDALADAVVLRGAARELRSQATDAMNDASRAAETRDEAIRKARSFDDLRAQLDARAMTIGVVTKQRDDARAQVAEMHRKWELERMQTMDLLNEVKAERRSIEQRVAKALELAPSGQTDGAHHKMWTIDQMVRALTGCPMVTKTAKDVHGTEYTFEAQGESEAYKAFVADARDGAEGPETYDWDTGIAG
jgi:chromosome segregation ATPase